MQARSAVLGPRQRGRRNRQFDRPYAREEARQIVEESDRGSLSIRALPGGAIDLGESMSQAGVREIKEETGMDCEILDVIGIYTDPKHIIL